MNWTCLVTGGGDVIHIPGLAPYPAAWNMRIRREVQRLIGTVGGKSEIRSGDVVPKKDYLLAASGQVYYLLLPALGWRYLVCIRDPVASEWMRRNQKTVLPALNEHSKRSGTLNKPARWAVNPRRALPNITGRPV